MHTQVKLVSLCCTLTAVSIISGQLGYARDTLKQTATEEKTVSAKGSKSPAKAKSSKVAAGKITEAKALDMVMAMPEVKQFFKEVAKSKIAKPTIDVDRKEGNAYVVHVYEVVNDGPETAHTATKNWYFVNIDTGKITKEF